MRTYVDGIRGRMIESILYPIALDSPAYVLLLFTDGTFTAIQAKETKDHAIEISIGMALAEAEIFRFSEQALIEQGMLTQSELVARKSAWLGADSDG
jgi:hypothetical protein